MDHQKSVGTVPVGNCRRAGLASELVFSRHGFDPF
jgi:hypothetical protein